MKQQKVRRFVHVKGFGDETKFMAFKNGQFWVRRKDGTRCKPGSRYTLRECLRFVRDGAWKELP